MAARILVIEDNEANLELVRYLLEYSGYEVLAASDGVEGLAVARRERPDLIVCDLQMPRLDGFGVLAELRSLADSAEWVVVALTAFSMPVDKRHALNAGFNGYFAKPIEPETFVGQIEAFLLPERRAAHTSGRSDAAP